MELVSNRPVGLVLMTGSVLFLLAAFMPYSRVFMENEPASRLDIINQRLTQWNIGQVLFALGSLVAALGLGFLLLRYRGSAAGNWARVGTFLLLAGAALWTWHCMERLISPEGFVNGTLTPYLFTVYSIFTQAGLICFGIFLLGTDLSGWTGWMLIAGTGIICVLYIIFKDMPPFVYYVFTLVLAIKLMAQAGVNTVL